MGLSNPPAWVVAYPRSLAWQLAVELSEPCAAVGPSADYMLPLALLERGSFYQQKQVFKCYSAASLKTPITTAISTLEKRNKLKS